MSEPTFSELANARVDPGLGTGTPAPVYNFTPLLNTINEQAQFKAQNDWNKYKDFQGKLSNIMGSIQDTARLEVMPQDREQIRNRMTDLFSQIEENPHALFGGPGYDKMLENLTKLDFDAAESAKNYVYDKAHRELLSKEPSYNTPENKKVIEDFANGPLGTRKSYTLNMPGLFDPLTLSDAINEHVKQNYSETKLSDDGKFIDTFTGTKYPEDAYKKVAGSLLELPDARNVPLRSTVQQRFTALPDEIRKQYESQHPDDPVKGYYMDLMDQYRKADQTNKSGSKDNPFALLDAKQKNAFIMEAVKQGNRKGLALLKHNLAGESTDKQNEVLLNLAGDVLSNTTGKTLAVQESDGKYSTEPVLDVSTPIKIALSEKGREAIREGSNLDEIGETITTTDMPDAVTRTKQGGLRTVYYKKYTREDLYDATGKPKKGVPANRNVGDVVNDKNGNPIYRSQQVVPQTETLKILGKDLFDKKQLAAGVGNVMDYLNKNHKGNILDYIKSQKESSKKFKTPAGGVKSLKELKEKYSDEQIKKAIQDGIITEENEDDEENQ